MRASARRNTASYRHELAPRSREPIRWNERTRFNVANVRHGRKSNEQLDLGGLQHSRIANQRPDHDAACSLVTALTYSGGVLVGSKALHGSLRVADVDQLVLVGGLENELRSRDRERDRKRDRISRPIDEAPLARTTHVDHGRHIIRSHLVPGAM